MLIISVKNVISYACIKHSPPGMIGGNINKKIFDKEAIVTELQAEPWVAGSEKTMDLGQFKNNIEFAKNTGLKEFYLWGSEWWYWLKQKQNDSGIWNEAKKLF